MKSILLLAIVFVGCTQSRQAESADAWSKIKLDFKKFDNDGLAGPPNGKVAGNYEFCIPATEKNWRQVKKIDATAEKSKSKGRINCNEKSWLVIGSTHQKHFQRVLFELASLSYVKEIQETTFE